MSCARAHRRGPRTWWHRGRVRIRDEQLLQPGPNNWSRARSRSPAAGAIDPDGAPSPSQLRDIRLAGDKVFCLATQSNAFDKLKSILLDLPAAPRLTARAPPLPRP
ncbi:sulfurtransferase [Streptomyces laurentii]|uniref:Sulfurtransferase n=1 Tax=Streptomyces laurentii TaxID=39478 RepID=A0A169PNF9_STRLU|nr:sulfurtransferase [Streptomyces laurentii]